MDINSFIDAYKSTGNLLFEDADVNSGNVEQWTNIFSDIAPQPAPKPTASTAPNAKGAQEESAAAPGVPFTTSGKESGGVVEKIKFRPGPGAGFGPLKGLPQNGTITFSKEGWDAIVAAYTKNPEGVAAQAKTDGVGDTEAEQTGEQTPEEQAMAQKEQSLQIADAATSALEQIAPEAYPDEGGALKRLMRQVMGFGAAGKMREAASGEDISPEERQETAQEVVESATKILEIGNKLEQGKPLTETEKDFVRKCVRLRGSSDKTRGVYLKGGDECGGELAAAGARITKRGDVYGVKIGTMKSSLWQIMDDLHSKCVEGDKQYCGEDEKPIPFHGGGDAAKSHQFRSLMGVLNEYGPTLAQAWTQCGREQPCKELDEAILKMYEDVKDRFDLKLLLWGAEQMNAGKLKEDELEFAGLDVEGTVKILAQIEDELDKVPDAKTALAWIIGKQINQWDAVVNHPELKDCEWNITGRGPTGIQDDGTSVNEDVQMKACSGKGGAKKILKKLARGSKFHVEREHYTKEEDLLGASVKNTDGGTTIDTGKRSANVIDGIPKDKNAEKSRLAREGNMDYREAVADQHGHKLPPNWREKADKYHEEEQAAVGTLMGGLQADSQGTIQVLEAKLKAEGYEEGKATAALIKQAKKYAKEKDPKKKEKLSRELRLKLTNGYRKAHQNHEGFLANMAIEAGMTGMSSQSQGMIINDGQTGETFLGLESDVAGQAMAGIMGIGVDKPYEVRVNSTGVNFYAEGVKGPISSLNRRMKEGMMSSFFLVNTAWAKSQLENLGQGGPGEGQGEPLGPDVGNSAMKAEHFVRQLQELIKGIDKVLTV